MMLSEKLDQLAVELRAMENGQGELQGMFEEWTRPTDGRVHRRLHVAACGEVRNRGRFERLAQRGAALLGVKTDGEGAAVWLFNEIRAAYPGSYSRYKCDRTPRRPWLTLSDDEEPHVETDSGLMDRLATRAADYFYRRASEAITGEGAVKRKRMTRKGNARIQQEAKMRALGHYEGRVYCQELDAEEIRPRPSWKRHGFPTTYLAAYDCAEERKRHRFRKLIQDEKYRICGKKKKDKSCP